ncbi:formyl peptide receptor-related sequence 6-like [Ostrea edulis]|uniref:formyl peptide receptor-related sequence 6-like n=1 Tax=Ostrea edulis TaxID=37623 RepID=UPI0024AF7A48|nr:formyl peptide receptor-related sequence 6-like [Ostrea edulis]
MSNTSNASGPSTEGYETTEVFANMTSSVLVSENASKQWIDYIQFVFLPITIVLGIVGNLLTIIIMLSERFANSPSSILLILLSLSDLVALLSQPFNKTNFNDLIGLDIRAFTDSNCKLYILIRRTSKMMSSWAVVGLCLERFIAVWFPLKAKLFVTKRLVLILVISGLVIIASFNAVWSYASKVVNGRCNPDVYDYTNSTERLKYGVMLQFGTGIYSNVPIILLTIFTTLIATKLFYHRRKRRSMTSRSSGDQDVRITAMLIGIAIAYVILIFPITVLHNIAYQKRLHAFTEASDGFSLYKEIAQFMEKLNYCLNFFLYVMTSSQFRQELRTKLFSCRCKPN